MDIRKGEQINSNPKSPRFFDDLDYYKKAQCSYPSAIVISYGCAIDYIIAEYPNGSSMPKHGHEEGGEFMERLVFNQGEFIVAIEAETGIYKDNGIIYSLKFRTSSGRELSVTAKPSGFYTKKDIQVIELERNECVACFYGNTARANDDFHSEGYLSSLGVYVSQQQNVQQYKLNESCIGFAEYRNNCWNFSIIAKDATVDALTNEYYAGYIQGKLQGEAKIRAARNVTWKNSYLCDTSHTFPRSCPPATSDMDKAREALRNNYNATTRWIEDSDKNTTNSKYAQAIERLFYRMWGIYDSLNYGQVRRMDEVKKDIFEKYETFDLGYGDERITLGDIYFINTQMDLMDVVANSLEMSYGFSKSDHCSAFAKYLGNGDIVWTHNSWCGYLSQSHTISYAIRNNQGKIDFISQNSYCFGQIGSNMDFGFNGHGICFNETTHRYSYNALSRKEKETRIWLCWRSAAAEMFATSIEDFYDYITVDNSGTYLNGYTVIDAKKKDMALIEMSYKRFAKFYSNGKALFVTEKINGEERNVPSNRYDTELITPQYVFGINYPVSNDVADDLKSTDNRPMRRIQFKERIGTVSGINTAKALITYISPEEPLSIYGRWDLGYGTTEYPKTIPDGAVDSKVFSADEVCDLLEKLKFEPSEEGGTTSFWMLYGVALFNGKPFVWSESEWAEYKDNPENDFVPDELTGTWDKTNLFMD